MTPGDLGPYAALLVLHELGALEIGEPTDDYLADVVARSARHQDVPTGGAPPWVHRQHRAAMSARRFATRHHARAAAEAQRRHYRDELARRRIARLTADRAYRCCPRTALRGDAPPPPTGRLLAEALTTAPNAPPPAPGHDPTSPPPRAPHPSAQRP